MLHPRRKLIRRRYGKGVGSIFQSVSGLVSKYGADILKKVQPLAEKVYTQGKNAAIQYVKDNKGQLLEKAKDLGLQKLNQIAENVKNGATLEKAKQDAMKQINIEAKDAGASKDKVAQQAKDLVNETINPTENKAPEKKSEEADIGDLLSGARKEVEAEMKKDIESGVKRIKKVDTSAGAGLRVAGTGLSFAGSGIAMSKPKKRGTITI